MKINCKLWQKSLDFLLKICYNYNVGGASGIDLHARSGLMSTRRQSGLMSTEKGGYYGDC